MARMRTLKPQFFLNEGLAEIEPLGRLLFQGLWCIADRAGRLEDRPRRIKAEVLPYDDGADVNALLRSFIETPDGEKGWVVLLGNRGTGKTHLLAAVANALMARGESALYVVAPDFLDYLRAGYDSDRLSEKASRRMEDARNAPVLLLDDLGVEKSSAWTDEQLYRLFNHRYNEGLPTVVASNVPLGELEPRIASRLQDSSLSRLVMLAGADQRIAGGRKR